MLYYQEQTPAEDEVSDLKDQPLNIRARRLSTSTVIVNSNSKKKNSKRANFLTDRKNTTPHHKSTSSPSQFRFLSKSNSELQIGFRKTFSEVSDKKTNQIKSKNLMELDLSEGRTISDRNILLLAQILKSNPEARTLKLSKCGLTNPGVKKLLILLLSHGKVKNLDLSNNLVTEEILYELDDVSRLGLKLKHISFRGCGVLNLTED